MVCRTDRNLVYKTRLIRDQELVKATQPDFDLCIKAKQNPVLFRQIGQPEFTQQLSAK